MKVTMTLSRYMARTYVMNMLFLLFALLGVIYLFDTVELVRRASKSDSVPLGLVLQMGLLKLPEVGQILFPFAVLFSAMLTFWQFNRHSELVVLRSSGFSVWQFLMPVVAVALCVGFLQVGVINPVGSLLVEKYERLEKEYLDKQDSQIALFKEGLWLRQSTDGHILEDDDDVQKGYVILHARKVKPPHWGLSQVSVFYFGQNDVFRMRADAKSASLEPGRWVFEDVAIHRSGSVKISKPEMVLPTTLTIEDIEESFSSAETVPFWALPAHIETLEQTGFDASRLRVYFHSLLSQPLFFVAMVLLAASVSIRPPRMGGGLMLFAVGVFIGFVVFFVSSYLQALGSSNQIPPILAAWSPAIVCFLYGVSAMIHLEDG
ncbi:MAG TPA: LPS export ABC transporter permease LptG [Alphaproteobacteria bacterium]|nr:LPS export ABC transporter permease LptG [Alphaproteobacteria bacterium]USO05339.1 MAG: LPS export ABC transporter permease LptG [Rhodospirillales bacterium]HOO81238.1 LPS export ABC transporter permease LptG [Alphaproteobacteria bacterium]